MQRHVTGSIALLAVVALLSGCSLLSQRKNVTWDEREDEDPAATERSAATEAPATTDAAPVKASPRELARTLPSAQACLEVAEANDAKSRKSGWAMLLACGRRDDFIAIDALVSERWRSRTQKSKYTAKLVNKVIANRGGRVEEDLAVLQRNGVELLSLEQALARAEQSQGKIVLARGRIAAIARDGNRATLQIAETGFSVPATTAPSSDDEPDEVADLADAEPETDLGEEEDDGAGAAEPEVSATGRLLTLQANKLDASVHEGDGWVFALRFTGKLTCADENDPPPTACAGGQLTSIARVRGARR